MDEDAPGLPGKKPTLVLTVAIGALGGLAFFGSQTGWLLVLDLCVWALSCTIVPVMLRGSVLAGVVLNLLAVLSPVATPAANASALIVAQRRPFAVAAKVAAVGIGAHAVRGILRPADGISYGWWLGLMAVAYAALLGWGALTQARRALMGSLRERARRAEAEQGRRVAEARVQERAAIAREMHDVLAHRLSLVATYAGALEYRADASPEQVSRAAGVVREGVHQALVELREVISVLRDFDSVAEDQRPQPVLADIPRLVAEAHEAGDQVLLDDRTAEAIAVPAAAGRAAYRVVQEGLTNARKHANGQPVRVVLDGRPGETLTIDISNTMLGDEPAQLVPGSGSGLIGLTERVQLAGGRLDHEMIPGREFRVHAWLPWPK
ncbi:histidine kinase [Actinocorallia lasiicapitis]